MTAHPQMHTPDLPGQSQASKRSGAPFALASRPTPVEWMDAADRAFAEAKAFERSGSHPLAKCRHQDAVFCNEVAIAMLASSRRVVDPDTAFRQQREAESRSIPDMEFHRQQMAGAFDRVYVGDSEDYVLRDQQGRLCDKSGRPIPAQAAAE